MAPRTVEDQAQSLLQRRVAEARRRGALSSDTETIALFESIALNLLLKPKTALWFALLANNSLRTALTSEIASIDALKSAIEDVNNVAFEITSTKQLEAARTSLLQLERLDKVSTESIQYKKFDSSISEFLTKALSKSVRKKNSTELVRPGSEAAQDVSTEFQNLASLHDDTTQRLYALAVGIDNFLTSPLSTIIGLTTVSRVRSDIESLISDINSGADSTASRDMAIRLISNRATVSSIGDLPKITDPVIDTVKQLPSSYEVKAVSDPAAATVTSTTGPFTFPVAASMTVETIGSTLGPFTFPQSTFDLNNKAAVVSSVISFPITVPANFYLFVLVDGTSYKIGPLTAGASVSKAAFLSDLSAKITASPLAGVLHAAEFIKAGTNRLIIYHDSAGSLSIVPTHTGNASDTIGGSDPTTPITAYYTNSIHSTIGFVGNETGTSGSTTFAIVRDALQSLFGTIATTIPRPDQSLTLSAVDASVGALLRITGTAATTLTVNGTFQGQSSTFRLYGLVQGVQTDPVNPIGLLDIGDTVDVPTGRAVVQAISKTRITLNQALPTFDGSISVTSSLQLAYNSLIGIIKNFLRTWLSGPFFSNLEKISLALSTIKVGASQSQRNLVLDQLNALRDQLSSLQSQLVSIGIGPSAASQERSIADGIMASLEERKFDKALDLFLRCQIQEALDSTIDTASFGNSLLTAASTFARTDMVLPNRALDEQSDDASSQDIKGL